MSIASTNPTRASSRISFGCVMGSIVWAIAVALASQTVAAQTLSPAVRSSVRIDTAVFALTHVRVIEWNGRSGAR